MNYVAFSVVLLLLLLTVNVSGLKAESDSIPKSTYNTTRAEQKKIKEEVSYYYKIMEYEPHIEVEPIPKREDFSYDTPEDAVIAFHSSMFYGDYEMWLNSWTNESREGHLKKNKERGLTKDYWIKRWYEGYKDRILVFTNRIESGKYVLICYELQLSDGTVENELHIGAITLVKEDGKWLATQELSSDPVFLYWRNPDAEIKRLGRY